MSKPPDSFREEIENILVGFFGPRLQSHQEKQYALALDAICELHEREIGMRVGFLRQWLNEDRITDKKLVTNEEIKQMLGLNRKE